jgi:Cyclic nucleotide-binding domain
MLSQPLTSPLTPLSALSLLHYYCTDTVIITGTGEEREVMRLGKGDFFGERALLKNEPRGANVIATGYVDCLVLERADFNQLLGPLEKVRDSPVTL